MRRMYVLLFLLSISVVVFAQEDRTALSRQVTDTAGRLVINASVSVTDVARGIVRTALTNDSGTYAITGAASWELSR
jgi:hypothetical protein